MSDKPIGRYTPDPVRVREIPEDLELRRRVEALFKKPGGLDKVNIVRNVQSASPPRTKPQTLTSANNQTIEYDEEREIEFLRTLLGVNAPLAPPVQFEIINQQQPLPPKIGVPTIMKLEPNGQLVPFGTNQAPAEAKSPQEQPANAQVLQPTPLIDVEQRKADVRKELGLGEDYMKTNEVNLSQAVILLEKLGLDRCSDSENNVYFAFPVEYTAAQYAKVRTAIEYYAFCAGVRGDTFRYENGRKLLETLRARSLKVD